MPGYEERETTMQANGGEHAVNRGMTWQRGAVWMARAGYSDLELSAFLTIRRVAGGHRQDAALEPVPFPVQSEPLAYSAAD